MVNELLNVSTEDISKIKITASGQVDKSITITDGQQLETAVQALSEDLNNQSFAQMTSSFGDYATIEILLNNNKTIYMNWDSSYTQFSKWMESTGQSEKARLMADDISYIPLRRPIRKFIIRVLKVNLHSRLNNSQIA